MLVRRIGRAAVANFRLGPNRRPVNGENQTAAPQHLSKEIQMEKVTCYGQRQLKRLILIEENENETAVVTRKILGDRNFLRRKCQAGSLWK
jgi:hypothetical protein